MKKYLMLLTIFALSFFLIGCDKNELIEEELGNEITSYKLSYMSTDITPGSTFNQNNISKEPLNVFEKKGCALYGADYYYTYDDIEIVANLLEDETTLMVYSVTFLNESAKTNEGIKIGSTVDELVEAYGNNYDEFNGVYTYSGSNLYITFITSDNLVTSIEYTLITN